LNETGFGTWGRAYFGHVSLSDALAGTVGYLGLAIALIATRRRRLGLWRRGAIAVAAYLVVALPALSAAEALVKFSQPLSVVAVRVAAIAFIATIWWFLPAGLLK